MLETVFFQFKYENMVLHLMPAGASLKRFGEKDFVFIKWKMCRHSFKNEWTLIKVLKIFFNISNTRSWLGFAQKRIQNPIEEIVFEKSKEIAISEDHFFNNVSNMLFANPSRDLVFEISEIIQNCFQCMYSQE